jgi:hypothetical protein
MARSRGRKRTLDEQLAAVVSPGMLHAIAMGLELRKARPGATRLHCIPVALPLSLSIAEIFKRKKAADSGKPVPIEVDYLDGTPPVIVYMPLTSTPKSKDSKPGKPGAPRHPLTVERVQRAKDDHGTDTAFQLAQRLTVELRHELGADVPEVTKSLVRARLREAKRRTAQGLKKDMRAKKSGP